MKNSGGHSTSVHAFRSKSTLCCGTTCPCRVLHCADTNTTDLCSHMPALINTCQCSTCASFTGSAVCHWGHHGREEGLALSECTNSSMFAVRTSYGEGLACKVDISMMQSAPHGLACFAVSAPDKADVCKHCSTSMLLHAHPARLPKTRATCKPPAQAMLITRDWSPEWRHGRSPSTKPDTAKINPL